MSIIISAVICTHNREKFIREAVTSLLEQTLNKDLYEIIVVDNRSTDDTARIIKEMESRETNIRYVFEENLGLSYARNTGWQNSKGKYVAYLDDDAAASSGWLSGIVKYFEKAGEEIAVAGGKVEPIYEVPPPKWLTSRLKSTLAVIDWSESPLVLSKGQWLAGVNMAYRKKVLEKFSGFQTELGLKGRNLMSMSEIFMEDRLAANGYKVYYDPKILVKHYIPRSRLTKKWFIRRYYWQGISEARYQLMTALAGAAYLTRLKRALSYSRTLFLPGRWLKNSRRQTSTYSNTNTKVTKSSKKRFTTFELTCFSTRKVGYIIGLLGKYKN
ncbi:MAG: glycosyltransferase [Candidatus Aminicenantes bacterium]|nr:glycosyltransferase [Candidatus Aminicenantes bacterium]NIM82021.1 glycosyltransferase [Candidatus Aminicenantes bacterium]NIN21405.1 glycosyltransferase [Candidatus Aminicenantes bacterium]NIN45232.1 glycosyltransferase [Candidatus Aminicenantes bacterium]NIN88052.1 glycosyltransferase [Candidatus Aminicenantes bacterium]